MAEPSHHGSSPASRAAPAPTAAGAGRSPAGWSRGGGLIPGLGVSTSRYGLVSAENPDQARMLAVLRALRQPGRAGVPAVGRTAAARQAVVDAWPRRWRAGPAVDAGACWPASARRRSRRCCCCSSPTRWPKAKAGLPKGLAVADLIEGGLPAWFGAIERQIQAGLDGEGAGADPEAAAEGLRGLAERGPNLRPLPRRGGRAGEARGRQRGGAPHGRDARGYLTTVDGEHHVISMFPD
jgi:hypothetical protein